MAYGDDDVGNQMDMIFIEPPDVNADTDEDSADEDDGGMIHNLTGRQLRSAAEVKLSNNKRIGVDYDESVPVEQPEPLTSLKQTTSKEPTSTPSTSAQQVQSSLHQNPWIENRLTGKPKPEWVCGDLEQIDTFFPPADYSRFKNVSCVEVFELFIDEEIIQYFVEETQSYAQYKNQPDPQVTTNDIKCFIGILILSGYNPLPSKRMFWDMKDDVKNILVSNAMRRNRFLQIQRFLHFQDNTKIDASDKAWKIRPLMDKIKGKCLQHFIPVKELAYDESMIKYFGRHGCKQFIRGKPIRFGYKMWSLNTKEGYLVNFDLYQGTNPRGNKTYDTLFGKAAAPLVLMIDELPVKNLKYNLHVDNLFTGTNLFSYLRHLGYDAVGTIRANRIPQSCPLEDKTKFAKRARGESQHILERSDGILFVRWMDNSVVTMASTGPGVSPLGSVKRYSQKVKRNIVVNRPNCIAHYNNNMGGTDLMDECVSNYRIKIRSKKWYWSIVTWLLDVSINNAWLLYRHNNKGISNLEFRREITQVYLARYGVAPKGPGRISLSRNLHSDIRFDRVDHFVSSCQRRRCAGVGCKSFGRTMCQKCNVGLCVACFAAYHTK